MAFLKNETEQKVLECIMLGKGKYLHTGVCACVCTHSL